MAKWLPEIATTADPATQLAHQIVPLDVSANAENPTNLLAPDLIFCCRCSHSGRKISRRRR
jgi:hypothetical protein